MLIKLTSCLGLGITDIFVIYYTTVTCNGRLIVLAMSMTLQHQNMIVVGYL